MNEQSCEGTAASAEGWVLDGEFVHLAFSPTLRARECERDGANRSDGGRSNEGGRSVGFRTLDSSISYEGMHSHDSEANRRKYDGGRGSKSNQESKLQIHRRK